MTVARPRINTKREATRPRHVDEEDFERTQGVRAQCGAEPVVGIAVNRNRGSHVMCNSRNTYSLYKLGGCVPNWRWPTKCILRTPVVPCPLLDSRDASTAL